MVPPAPGLTDQTKPVPLPPLAVSCCVSFGAIEKAAGETETPAVMVIAAVPVLPSESVTSAVSLRPPIAPAV